MRIVARNRPDAHLADIGAAGAAALKRWYASLSDEADDTEALAVIRHAAALDGWIECDCLGAAPQPLLAPRRDRHAHTIVRINRPDDDPRARPDRPNHAAICPFHFDRLLADAPVMPRLSMRPTAPRADAPFEALPAFAEMLASRDGEASGGNSAPAQHHSAIGNQMWRLLDAARRNVVRPVQDDLPVQNLSAHFRTVVEAAASFPVQDHRPLSFFLSTWAGDAFRTRSRWQRNFASARNDWPAGSRPTAWMLLFAKRITEGRIHPASQPGAIDVVNGVRQPHFGKATDRGPFAVLINFDEGNGGRLRAISAYAQPVHCVRTFMPVESGFERTVFDVLLAVQTHLAWTKPGLRITITKPLFSIVTDLGPCRPDFLLDIECDGRRSRLVIEAMGMETPDYLASKQITVPRMALLGRVVEIRPRDIADASEMKSRLVRDVVAATAG
jgi:hypothetical protein